MGIEITPSFTMQYERNMRAITETEYARRLASPDLWWNKIIRTMPIERAAERITWILNTIALEPLGPSGTGKLSFEDMVTQSVEYPVLRHGKGIVVQRDQIEDLDGTGLNMLQEWSSQMGNEIAYYPQRMASWLLLNGGATDGTALAYDSVPFFAKPTNPHLNNPFYSGTATQTTAYSNWLTGSAAPSNFSAYPGACPIDDVNAATTDVALQNLGKAIAYIASLKMPNNQDPRFLKVAYILAPPRMAPRLRQLLDAKFIAAAASSGGGSADIVGLVSGWQLGTPIIADELAASSSYSNTMMAASVNGVLQALQPATLTGSDTTYYIVTQSMQNTQLGGLLHLSRKPFKINYYTGDAGGTGQMADLDRRNEFEYHCQGRAAMAYGHPYSIFRCDGT
jgi:hypothetical protein